MTEYAEDIARWFQVNAGKLIWLTIVLAIVFVADRVISRVLRKILDNSQIPSASIFVNLTRVTIWVTGAAMVLQPVFGINPTTLITALGVGGVAISLGLKDTIANIIGGFGLMLGRVIQPGDLVTIQGVTGTVHDITWRQTVVRTRSGDMMVIPQFGTQYGRPDQAHAGSAKAWPRLSSRPRPPATRLRSVRYSRPRNQSHRRRGAGGSAAIGQVHRLLPLRHDRPSACVRARGCAAFHHQRYGGASHRRFGHRIPC